MNMNNKLFYNKPANTNIWEEALPLGNGFLGAMVYGGVKEERIKLNQESVWYGRQRNRINPDAKSSLKDIRDAIFDGQLQKAEELAYTKMFATPMSQGHYEPLADLKISFEQTIPHHSEWGKAPVCDWENYTRTLHLDSGTYLCKYNHENTSYKREMFISYPDRVMVIKLQAKGDRKLSFRMELERSDMYEELYATKDTITLNGIAGGGGIRFTAMAKLISTDGKVEYAGATVKVSGATEAIIFVTGSTDFYGHNAEKWCSKTIRKAALKTYTELKSNHIDDYTRLYNRVSLSLVYDKSYSQLPTDIRLKKFKTDCNDQGLIELFFNYSRYLLISCSRGCSLPANLQGIWSKDMQPPWGCKYTININTQMNYWLAETANLSECHTPLFAHIKRMQKQGAKTAKKMYGCRGIMAHHNTDIYGDCAPQDQWMPATIWPMGMAWLATHIIEHFNFNNDYNFIKKNYKLLKDASLFFVDFLIKDNNGNWVTCPSVSPENTYIIKNGEKSSLCYGPTMDSQIIRHLWSGFLDISNKLNKNNFIVKRIKEMIIDLPKEKVGSRGQILEWQEEYKEWEKGHRHISHLYGLHPGNTISKETTPDIFNAAKTTLEERLSYGGGHTGWSRAWIVNFYARLHDGNKALENIDALINNSTAVNLFDMHPPFQIDGNFGGGAGIIEMLMQSHENIIRLLPALPDKWKNGSIVGIKARNNITISIWWQDNKIIKASFISPISQNIIASINDVKYKIHLTAGEEYVYSTK